jgi:hypothetical protein
MATTVASLFATLITSKTRDEVLAEYIVVLQALGFPAMSWHSTSVPIRLLTAMAGTHAAFSSTLESISRGGFVQLATGSWLTLLAKSMYQVDRYEASTTQLYCSIADLASAGPFNVTAGQLSFATASGKVFTNDDAFTIALDGVTDFTVSAEATGATYNLGADELVTLLTPLPGTGYAVHTEVRTEGSAPPAVTVSGTPATEYEFVIEITTAGALGAGKFRWSLDGGANWTSNVTLAATVVLGATGVTAAFAAGAYTTAHSYEWNSGCLSFNPRSDCVATTGTDEESDALLQQRCEDKWSTLGYGSNDDWYRYYCRATPTYGVNVTRVKVDTSAVGTGAVTLTFAGPSGAVDVITLAAVDTYMQAIKPNCVTLTVQNATEVDIIPVGTAYVYADYADVAQSEMEDYLSDYLGEVEIGGVVYLSQVVDALQYDGDQVRNVALTSPTTDTTLGATSVPARGTFAGLSITSV